MTPQLLRVTVITGASSGIGASLAYAFARDGHTLALISRRAKELSDVADRCHQLGGKAVAYPCDITDKQAVKACVRQVLDELGQVDTFIANAGISLSSEGHVFNAYVFEKTWKTNLIGHSYFLEGLIPVMKKRGSGHLVGIGSLASYRGLPGAGAYCSSKAAMVSLFESLRIDLKPYGICVSMINPGYIKTPLTDKNRFYMPFLMETEEGVRHIYRAIKKKKSLFAFPKPLVWALRLSRCVPIFLFDRIISPFRNVKDPE